MSKLRIEDIDWETYKEDVAAAMRNEKLWAMGGGASGRGNASGQLRQATRGVKVIRGRGLCSGFRGEP